MSLALAALEPKIEQLLEALDRIADASERSADALEKLVGAQAGAQADAQTDAQTDVQASTSNDGEATPEIDLGRLDGIG